MDTLGLVLAVYLIPALIGSVVGVVYHALKRTLAESVFWRALIGVVVAPPCALTIIWVLAWLAFNLERKRAYQSTQGLTWGMIALFFTGCVLSVIISLTFTIGIRRPISRQRSKRDKQPNTSH